MDERNLDIAGKAAYHVLLNCIHGKTRFYFAMFVH